MSTSTEYRAAARSLERAADELVRAVLPVTNTRLPRASGRTGATIASAVDVTVANVGRAVDLLHREAREARHRAAVIDALSGT